MSREVCGICWCPYDEDTKACACVPAQPRGAMNREDIIRMAREAECEETWGADAFRFGEVELERFFKLAYDAGRKAALAEPVQDGCDHCNHPLYAAIKCKVCGRVTEPVQEPYAWMSVGGSIWRHKTREDDVPLYASPRTPLAEWQINDLMSDIDPEDRDSWSFRQGVYAAEKHHGVRR